MSIFRASSNSHRVIPLKMDLLIKGELSSAVKRLCPEAGVMPRSPSHLVGQDFAMVGWPCNRIIMCLFVKLNLWGT